MVRGKIDYGSSIYGGAKQIWQNKITVAFNKGLKICMRFLSSTTIVALEVETRSVPLFLRRKFVARKEILRTFEHGLLMVTRLNGISNDLDAIGPTLKPIVWKYHNYSLQYATPKLNHSQII